MFKKIRFSQSRMVGSERVFTHKTYKAKIYPNGCMLVLGVVLNPSEQDTIEVL